MRINFVSGLDEAHIYTNVRENKKKQHFHIYFVCTVITYDDNILYATLRVHESSSTFESESTQSKYVLGLKRPTNTHTHV